ncbi:MAG TPA: hypothetical protein DDY68_00825 [Porphyromonadaceae bacterium]|nr:hypothetical protein [Porphyromonadaceae bacterium]
MTMKFQVSSSALSNVLQVLNKVISPKAQREIMQSFLMSIEGNNLVITATDAELTLTTSIELINSEGNFSFAINAKKLTDAVKDLPEQPISLDFNEQNEVVLYYQNGKYTFTILSAEDFPNRENSSNEELQSIAITREALADGITKTLFATSTDDFKPALCGILLDIHTDNITFVSTDTHRMIRYIMNNFSGEK